MDQNERRLFLIKELIKENKQYKDIEIPKNTDEQKLLLRALMNIRMPRPAAPKILSVQDAYLREELKNKGVVRIDDMEELKPGIYLYQGDITRIECDAIVNAANSGMTGCYIPNHNCIDNCIHTFAGMQLREDCYRLMQMQGHEEPVGTAKLTRAYNLPCRYVIHTVGPMINGRLTEHDKDLLAACYRSCLELAEEYKLSSITFCCISTGVFRFPNEAAAEIAVAETERFLNSSTYIKKVIFNVFKDLDKDIYFRLLS